MAEKKEKAIFTVGRRKTAVARIKLVPGSGAFVVNGRKPEEYFPTSSLQYSAFTAQKITKQHNKIDLLVRVKGGGITGQAEACRLGIARALQIQDIELRPALKKAGYLRRDSRMVERKKYGLHKARRGTQFSKR